MAMPGTDRSGRPVASRARRSGQDGVPGPRASKVQLPDERPPGRAASAAKRKTARRSLVVSVSDAVLAELERLAVKHPELASSPLAMSVLAMAREIDDPGNSATSKSMCQARLVESLDRLRELIPTEEEGDALDELSARRATRIAGRSGT